MIGWHRYFPTTFDAHLTSAWAKCNNNTVHIRMFLLMLVYVGTCANHNMYPNIITCTNPYFTFSNGGVNKLQAYVKPESTCHSQYIDNMGHIWQYCLQFCSLNVTRCPMYDKSILQDGIHSGYHKYVHIYCTVNVHMYSNWLLAFQTAAESSLLYCRAGWVDLQNLNESMVSQLALPMQ